MRKILSFISSVAILGIVSTSVFAQTTPGSSSTPGSFVLPDISKIREEQERSIRERGEEFKRLEAEAIKKGLEDARKANEEARVTLGLKLDRTDLKPGNRVRISVETYSLNLGQSTVTWYHNGKRVSSGSGNASYSFVLGDLGTAENIRAVITTTAGDVYEVLKTVRPARIYITWGADSYTPPWYRGKTLPPPGAPIKIVAIPDFRIGTTVLPTQDIIYEWLINDAPRTSSSGANGKGKNTFSFTTGSSASVEYKVTVRGKDARERIVHEESFTVRAHRPELVFYERDPLLGLKYWQALREFKAPSGKDLVIQFEPFNLHNQDLGRLFYSWRVNSKKLANQNPQSRIFRLSSEAGSVGSQSINISYENPDNIFMRGSAQVTVKVGE
ncbi:MAG: hypothetical protein AAB367_02540 [Patescibacteria group bacterium]